MNCCENTKHIVKDGKFSSKISAFPNKSRRKLGNIGVFDYNEESVKGGKNMVEIKKKLMLWIVIGILFIATIFLTLKSSSIGTESAQATALVAKTAASSGTG